MQCPRTLLTAWLVIKETLRAKQVRKVASSTAVSTADDDDVLVAEQEAVAGGAPRHAPAGVLGPHPAHRSVG